MYNIETINVPNKIYYRKLKKKLIIIESSFTIIKLFIKNAHLSDNNVIISAAIELSFSRQYYFSRYFSYGNLMCVCINDVIVVLCIRNFFLHELALNLVHFPVSVLTLDKSALHSKLFVLLSLEYLLQFTYTLLSTLSTC